MQTIKGICLLIVVVAFTVLVFELPSAYQSERVNAATVAEQPAVLLRSAEIAIPPQASPPGVSPYEGQPEPLPEYAVEMESMHPAVVTYGENWADHLVQQELTRLNSTMTVYGTRARSIYDACMADSLWRVNQAWATYGQGNTEQDADAWAGLQFATRWIGKGPQ